MRYRSLTLAGVLAAIVVLLLYLAMVVPGGKAALYAAASLPLALLVIEGGKKMAALFYLATAVLALLLLPDKAAALPYVFVLGLYGLIKSVAEERKRRLWEWALKYAYCNAALALYFLLIVKVVFPGISWPISPLWLGIAAQPLFLLYDLFYSLSIAFYLRELRPRVFPHGR